MSANGVADEVHEGYCQQAAGKGKTLNGQNWQREKNGQHRAERGTAGNAENVGRH